MRHISALFLSLLSLPLFAAITGTVMTTDGVAIGGARVSIHALETPYARRARLLSRTPDTAPLASAQTDERGSFSLASPKEPVVDLRVEMRGYDPFVRRVEGDAADVAIALRKADLVKGSVTAGGKPVAKALVMLGADFVTRTDEQGRYEVPAIQQSSILAVIHPGHAIDVELLPNGSAQARELIRTLGAGVTLAGRAVAADGTSPVAGAEISVDDWPLAVSGQDGAFTIAHAPANWTTITARKGTLTGSHTAGGAKTILVRLEPSAVVSGRVLDAKTNAPVAGAMVGVSLSSESGVVGPAAITDAGGTYSVPVPAGSLWLSSAHPSYARHANSIRIAPGQQLASDFALAQLARVSGVVLDDAGSPVAAATVSPERPGLLGMLDMKANGAVPVTAGPDGKFNVRVVPGHDFVLEVRKKGLPRGRSEVMKLDAGARKSAVVLTLPAGVTVTGRALDAGGKPLSGVSVVAGPAATSPRTETLDTIFEPLEQDPVRSAGDGTFTMRVPEGRYNFWFRREGYLGNKVGAKSITAAGDDVDNTVEVRLDPAVEISGRVTRGGVGVADVEVHTEGAYQNTATTDSDGSFVLGGLAPGVKKLEVRKQAERIDETRNVTAPARDVVIDLPAGGTIRGRAVEKGTQTPIRSFEAGVMAGLGNLRRFSSEDGSFTLEYVPAGSMTVAVNARGYVGAGRKVHVVSGETVNDVVVELEKGTRLTGKVTDANGAPVSGVSITILPPTSEGGTLGGVVGGWGTMTLAGPNAPRERPVPRGLPNHSVTTVTDANGTYTLDGLLPGEESVEFAHPRYIDTIRKVTLEGPETKLDVQLSPGPP